MLLGNNPMNYLHSYYEEECFFFNYELQGPGPMVVVLKQGVLRLYLVGWYNCDPVIFFLVLKICSNMSLYVMLQLFDNLLGLRTFFNPGKLRLNSITLLL